MVTLKEIAKLSGVSAACVSNVLNGKGNRYSAETNFRILDIAQKLNYRSNMVAKSMVTKSSRVLGLIIPDITNPFFPAIVRGVEAAASQMGYSVLFIDTMEDVRREQEAFGIMEQNMAEGIIFIPSLATPEDADFLNGFSTPFVTVDRVCRGKGLVGQVACDNQKGAHLGVEFLHARGKRQILFLMGPAAMGGAQKRRQSIAWAAKSLGLCVPEDYFIHGDFSAAFGGGAIDAFLQAKKPFDAVFATSDIIALGAIRRLKDEGIRVPDDIAVMGYDNIDMCRYVDPPLTTISQPQFEMGWEACSLLVEKLQNGDASFTEKTLDVSLVLRESVM